MSYINLCIHKIRDKRIRERKMERKSDWRELELKEERK